MKHLLSRFALLSLLIVSSGCERVPPLPPVHTFVGHVEGSEAFVALSIVGGEVMAYVCDGRDTATWLRGTATDGDLALTADGMRLRAQRTAQGLTGTLTLETRSHAFTVAPAMSGGGFYRAAETIAGLGYVGGWILLNDGSQRGALKRDGAIVATDALDPDAPTVPVPSGSLQAQPVEAFLSEQAMASNAP